MVPAATEVVEAGPLPVLPHKGIMPPLNLVPPHRPEVETAAVVGVLPKVTDLVGVYPVEAEVVLQGPALIPAPVDQVVLVRW
jgi:hypothetical protein